MNYYLTAIRVDLQVLPAAPDQARVAAVLRRARARDHVGAEPEAELHRHLCGPPLLGAGAARAAVAAPARLRLGLRGVRTVNRKQCSAFWILPLFALSVTLFHFPARRSLARSLF